MYNIPTAYKISHASSNALLIIAIERRIKHRFRTPAYLYSAKLWLHKLVAYFVLKILTKFQDPALSGASFTPVPHVHVAMIWYGSYQVSWKSLGSEIIRVDRQMDSALVITWSRHFNYRKGECTLWMMVWNVLSTLFWTFHFQVEEP
jgi:hypothetical protein